MRSSRAVVTCCDVKAAGGRDSSAIVVSENADGTVRNCRAAEQCY